MARKVELPQEYQDWREFLRITFGEIDGLTEQKWIFACMEVLAAWKKQTPDQQDTEQPDFLTDPTLRMHLHWLVVNACNSLEKPIKTLDRSARGKFWAGAREETTNPKRGGELKTHSKMILTKMLKLEDERDMLDIFATMLGRER